MKNLFEHTASGWVRYDAYEWKPGADSRLYLTPAENAMPEIYDPLKDAQALVLDAVNIGRMCMRKLPNADIQAAILQFSRNYGLLGLMTALPTTPDFMEYEAVYLPKNHFIKAETMQTRDYLELFFPFAKPIMTKRGIESLWSIDGDKTMITLAMTMSDKPMAVNMEFQREYAERFDWLKQLFADWAFTLTTGFLYYEDYDDIDEDTRSIYRQGMAAFDGIAPTYHIELREKPTLVWDFHSLLLGVQMMFSFMMTDKTRPLRLCKHCTQAFIANRSNMVFCSPQCKSQHNVYRSRGKNSG